MLLNPRGFPTAIAQSPTCIKLESPKIATGKISSFVSTLTTAKSVISSVPFTSPINCLPSFKVTVTLSALLTTWALVKIIPFESTIKPEPWPFNNSFEGGWILEFSSKKRSKMHF